ncbi:probable indole-3-pyruvate monooxygenase YUCCA11 isoform X1 [Phalaenopsis equestris]|uniref:probable indole-3-pyruvate monooxygenase YUCCA11 isoform X1 n=1 Tax=Phalaenopsis equestris TaxID=78828 RepID=UPI0009E1BCB8|nr:probable indole-3-pyruvate monooxygenase YUCCA11 isoform X1 [Phalaenopsis equestris]
MVGKITRKYSAGGSHHPVIIIGAGPAGLSTAACLSVLSIPYVILERDSCIASLWRRRAYNRLKLHLAKRFCQLPHMPYPAGTPTYIPKDRFIEYLDDYAARFDVRPEFGCFVESAVYREGEGEWGVRVRRVNGEEREYVGGYVVVATGENGAPHVPEFEGMGGFEGEVVHSADYKSGDRYKGMRVLVVGCGNSGMEIAYDLASHGAFTYVCARSKFHVMSKEMIYWGMVLLDRKMPLWIVDKFCVFLSELRYGDLSKFGIIRPKDGPFFLKATLGKSPVIDVGTVHKIKTGEIQVLPGISYFEGGNCVKFTNGASHRFDAILFATGYKSIANKWVQDETNFLNEQGLPAKKFPDHWKGENGIYSAGLSRRGLDGIASDARLIANDINMIMKSKRPFTNHTYEACKEN